MEINLNKKQEKIMREIKFNMDFFHNKLPKSFYTQLNDKERGEVIKALKQKGGA